MLIRTFLNCAFGNSLHISLFRCGIENYAADASAADVAKRNKRSLEGMLLLVVFVVIVSARVGRGGGSSFNKFNL